MGCVGFKSPAHSCSFIELGDCDWVEGTGKLVEHPSMSSAGDLEP